MKKSNSKFLLIPVIASLLVALIWFGPQLLQKNDAPEAEVPTVTEAPTDPTLPTLPPEPEIPAWAENLPERDLTAGQYFVYNTKTNTFLVQSSELNTRIYPASITKLMTALVAVDYLKPQEIITVGAEIKLIDRDSSVAGLQSGDTLTVAQLMSGMLLPSGNDAAYVMATAAGRKILNKPYAPAEDAITAFVDAMNTKATVLGMSGSHFMNPDGIHDDNHYMCIRDMALLGKSAMQHPLIRQCINTLTVENPNYDAATSPAGVPEKWSNTNYLLDPTSQYYCPNAFGLKTGYTGAAGSCLLSAFLYDNTLYIVGVFRCPWGNSRFEDTVQIFADNVIF